MKSHFVNLLKCSMQQKGCLLAFWSLQSSGAFVSPLHFEISIIIIFLIRVIEYFTLWGWYDRGTSDRDHWGTSSSFSRKMWSFCLEVLSAFCCRTHAASGAFSWLATFSTTSSCIQTFSSTTSHNADAGTASPPPSQSSSSLALHCSRSGFWQDVVPSWAAGAVSVGKYCGRARNWG